MSISALSTHSQMSTQVETTSTETAAASSSQSVSTIASMASSTSPLIATAQVDTLSSASAPTQIVSTSVSMASSTSSLTGASDIDPLYAASELNGFDPNPTPVAQAFWLARKYSDALQRSTEAGDGVEPFDSRHKELKQLIDDLSTSSVTYTETIEKTLAYIALRIQEETEEITRMSEEKKSADEASLIRSTKRLGKLHDLQTRVLREKNLG